MFITKAAEPNGRGAASTLSATCRRIEETKLVGQVGGSFLTGEEDQSSLETQIERILVDCLIGFWNKQAFKAQIRGHRFLLREEFFSREVVFTVT
jgi:hypothetical protein